MKNGHDKLSSDTHWIASSILLYSKEEAPEKSMLSLLSAVHPITQSQTDLFGRSVFTGRDLSFIFSASSGVGETYMAHSPLVSELSSCSQFFETMKWCPGCLCCQVWIRVLRHPGFPDQQIWFFERDPWPLLKQLDLASEPPSLLGGSPALYESLLHIFALSKVFHITEGLQRLFLPEFQLLIYRNWSVTKKKNQR